MHSNVMCNINNKCVKTQRNKTRRRDKETGLANTLYKVSARRELVIDTAPVTFLDIQLGESYIQGIDTVMILVHLATYFRGW